MARKFYSINQKLNMIRALEERSDTESVSSIARKFGVDTAQLRRWKAQKPLFESFNTRHRGTNLTIHRGNKCSFDDIEEELLSFIFEQRETGIPVSVRMVTTKASQLHSGFRAKSARAKDSAIRRFVSTHGLVHRVHTHQSQKRMEEVYETAKDWLVNIRPMLLGPTRDKRFIINMDQTPIFFSMTPRKTLERVGAQTVNVLTSTSSTTRVTVAVTVAASGAILPPLFVYKGKPGGRIEKREFSTFENGAFYTVQEKAWMDEKIMLKWVDKVLKPYVDTIGTGIICPILFLDSYRCHMMASVVNKIQDLGVQVEHIPGGCTGLLQPIDVGIGKPLKNRVRNCWEDWMVEQSSSTGQFDPPSRKTIASWVVPALKELPMQIVENSWRHKPYDYFEDNEEQGDNQREI